MVCPELREHLVCKNGMVPFLPVASIVNLMLGSTKFKWFNRVSTCIFKPC